jgi:hypothetical protein
VKTAADGERVGIVSGEKVVAGLVDNMQGDGDGERNPGEAEVPIKGRVEHERLPPDGVGCAVDGG